MMKWRKNFSKILIEHFWGIVISLAFVVSGLFILLFGIGPFVLLIIAGLVGFLIGDSIDRNVSLLQSLKDFLGLVKRFLTSLAGRENDKP